MKSQNFMAGLMALIMGTAQKKHVDLLGCSLPYKYQSNGVGVINQKLRKGRKRRCNGL